LRALPIPAKHLALHFATLGGDAGFVGAAGIARLHHQNKE
jgi:hypothetical protein